MEGNHSRSVKEQFGPKSEAWQEEHSPAIVRFWCSDGACWGIPFSQVLGTHYDPEQQRLLIECSIGSVVVIGPKAWDFYDAFCSQRATMLKADGKDILNVTMVLRGEAAPGIGTNATLQSSKSDPTSPLLPKAQLLVAFPSVGPRLSLTENCQQRLKRAIVTIHKMLVFSIL